VETPGRELLENADVLVRGGLGQKEAGRVGDVHEYRHPKLSCVIPDRVESPVVDRQHIAVGISELQSEFLGDLQPERALLQVRFQRANAFFGEGAVFEQAEISPLCEIRHSEAGEAAGVGSNVVIDKLIDGAALDGVGVVFVG